MQIAFTKGKEIANISSKGKEKVTCSNKGKGKENVGWSFQLIAVNYCHYLYTVVNILNYNV